MNVNGSSIEWVFDRARQSTYMQMRSAEEMAYWAACTPPTHGKEMLADSAIRMYRRAAMKLTEVGERDAA